MWPRTICGMTEASATRSPATVETHLTHAYAKLGVSGRGGLARALGDAG